MKNLSCKMCDRSATFGFKSDNLRRYCATHKEENMINLTKRYCWECNKTASFGFRGGPSAIYCSVHKQEDMIHTSSRKIDFLIQD